MVALAFFPVAWVERQGGMVSVEIIDMVLPEAGVRVLQRFVALISALVYGALTWFTWTAAVKNWETGTYDLIHDIYLPLWPGYFLLPAGFAVATLVALLRVAGPYAEVRS
jgi:TRAP-type C4-dicarboxylate transport system permease small subunit